MPTYIIPKSDGAADYRPEAMRSRARDLIENLDPSKSWEVKIQTHRKTRTLSQNALYWKWISIIADECGDGKDDVHEALKKKFLEPREVLGELVWSTKGLPTADMSAYMEKCEAWAKSFLALTLPHPSDQHLEGMPT